MKYLEERGGEWKVHVGSEKLMEIKNGNLCPVVDHRHQYQPTHA